MFDFYINFYYFPPVSQSTAYRMRKNILSREARMVVKSPCVVR